MKGMDEEDLPQYNEKVDIWSIGVVLYEALTGQQPFLAESPKEMAALQRSMLSSRDDKDVPMFFLRSGVPPLAASFLSEVFQDEPTRRPSARDLLSHPWLRSMLPASAQNSYKKQSSCPTMARPSLSPIIER